MRNFPNVYCSFSPGMPVVNGIPGSLVDMLKKVLTNGTDLFSFPEIKVLDGIATITALTENQVFFNESTISITGCDEPLLNGIKTVRNHGPMFFDFETTAADGTYGGSIKINQPGAGFTILYTGTNEVVFISSNLDTLGVCIKVKDTNASYADIEIYESMTSLNEGINKFDPTKIATNRIFRIRKSSLANTTPMNWWLVADNTNCHFIIERRTALNNDWQKFYGDMIISFGECVSFNKSYNKNFFFTCPPSLTTVTDANYTSNNANLLGVSQDGVFSAFGERYTGCYISNNDYQQYKMGCFQSNVQVNNTSSYYILSGAERNIDFKTITPLSFFVTPFILYNAELGVPQSAQPAGYLYESLFINQKITNWQEKFKIGVINGKKYILLPFYYNSAPLANSTPTMGCDFGLIPFLIGEKWGN